jgi:hypothetical protein
MLEAARAEDQKSGPMSSICPIRCSGQRNCGLCEPDEKHSDRKFRSSSPIYPQQEPLSRQVVLHQHLRCEALTCRESLEDRENKRERVENSITADLPAVAGRA